MVDEYLTGGGTDTTPRLGWFVIQKGHLQKIRDKETCKLLAQNGGLKKFLTAGTITD